ncbi:hypothetical protein [Streptomyces sp. NBC_01353]|uniref:hypothetical protein n=1 Tax=Streptomyces sp. NBC_01353 TaxID=2903835 RepID=UPI002E30DA7D|nr:hypothetical protein [Streptomyces sp. NBC_01353]
MNLWTSKNTKPNPKPIPISEGLLEEMVEAKRLGLQSDLRVLAQRLRAEAPSQSAGFDAGINWAVLWLENTATGLTRK